MVSYCFQGHLGKWRGFCSFLSGWLGRKIMLCSSDAKCPRVQKHSPLRMTEVPLRNELWCALGTKPRIEGLQGRNCCFIGMVLDCQSCVLSAVVCSSTHVNLVVWLSSLKFLLSKLWRRQHDAAVSPPTVVSLVLSCGGRHQQHRFPFLTLQRGASESQASCPFTCLL